MNGKGDTRIGPADLHWVKVDTYIVRWKCPSPCDGEMVPSGEVLTSYPPMYPHVCAECGREDVAGCTYPRMDYQ